jgi:hypothetical protein
MIDATDITKNECKQIRLHCVPDDVQEIIIKHQTEKMIEKKGKYSIQQAVYSLIRKAIKDETK